ncbi:helix-turn-helix domain-containing protein [Thalassobacillus sp. CUG 92003]|uniref:helix-turn-helix domain-containing protein n=1 Tax=Thalassobacillus sp. CUG 92003 TaxID=2736641 RepID=UPI0015E63112|nr:helix-turn-helix transcriptional regulator [Thalassobacillus sp. CUG 92003]
MIGDRLQFLRLQKGYTLSELARRSGVSKSYISNIERGLQKNPSLIVMKKLSETLDISVEKLLEFKHQQDSEK